MGQRVIPVAVTAEYIGGDGVTLGAAGSHNSVLIEYDFRSAGPQWDDVTVRYVLWTNPQGNTTNRVNLGVDKLVPGYDSKVYHAAPTADAMCVSGWAEMVVVGAIISDGNEVIKVKTEPSRFRVLPGSSSAADNEGIAATVADQLQSEIETVDSRKVSKPLDPLDPDGENGQFLVSRGDGLTEWVDFSADAVEEALEKHPEWVTTVQDRSISEAKLEDEAVTTKKIRGEAVTTSKLANRAVTADKLADHAVKMNHLASDVVGRFSGLESKDSSLQAQINALIAPTGEAPNAAEIVNARTDANGREYETLGDAVRVQGEDIKNAFTLTETGQFEEIRRLVTGESEESESGNTIRMVVHVGAGLHGKAWSSSDKYWLQGCMYSTKEQAFLSPTAHRTDLGYYAPYNSCIDVATVNGGWLVLSVVKNSSSTAITDAEKADILSSVQMVLTYESSMVDYLYGQLSDVLQQTLDCYPAMLQVNRGYMTSDNKLSVFAQSKHVVVECRPGTVLNITANAVRNTNYAWLKSYQEPKSSDAGTVFWDVCEGTERNRVEKGESTEDYAPDDCTHCVVFIQSDLGSHAPQTWMLGGTQIKWNKAGYIVINNRLDIVIPQMQEQIEAIENELATRAAGGDSLREKRLYIGAIGNYSLVPPNLSPATSDPVSGTIAGASSVQVSMLNAVFFPVSGATFTIHCPKSYQIGFMYGPVNNTKMWLWMNNDTGPMKNGATLRIDEPFEYRMYVVKGNGSLAVSEAEVQRLIDSGLLYVAYTPLDGTVVQRNVAVEPLIKNLMRPENPRFSHISDTHGDVVRLNNCLDYSDFLGVDAAFVTGDIATQSAKDRTLYFDDAIGRHESMCLLCIGNHDVRNRVTKQSQNVVINSVIEAYSPVTPEGEEYPTYYYKDLPDKSVRIIAVNQYEAGQGNTNWMRITQEQLEFFISALHDTPEGYGVIVLIHSPEKNFVPRQSKFVQYTSVTSTLEIICRIVDAFISRIEIDFFVEQEKSTEPYQVYPSYDRGTIETETLHIAGDFTDVADDVEFLFYASGHRHMDCVSYVSGMENLQLHCNITVGNALFSESDSPRGGTGVTQDAFNVYSIDRANKTLTVARIGSNMTYDFAMKDYEVIQYAPRPQEEP